MKYNGFDFNEFTIDSAKCFEDIFMNGFSEILNLPLPCVWDALQTKWPL